jgi:quercetin dioxygenase-like cupin family protein
MSSRWRLFCVVLVVLAINAQTQLAYAQSRITSGATVPTVQRAEWERRGQILRSEGPLAVSKAPAGASVYEVKTFDCTCGKLEVLTYKKGQPILHKITTETQLYILAGSVEVGVAGKPTIVSAGDAINLPTGALRSKAAAGDTQILAFSVMTADKEPKAQVVNAKDAVVRPSAQWMEEGKLKLVRLPEEIVKAPPGAGIGFSRPFGFNQFRLQNYKGGGKLASYTPPLSGMVYVVSGRSRIQIGDESVVVSQGDFVFEEGNVPHGWELSDEIVFLATNAPLKSELR